MARFVTVALLVIAFAATAAAARPVQDEPVVNAGNWAHSVVDVLKEWTNGRIDVEATALDAFSNIRDDEHEGKFYLLVKYIIRPSIQKEFVEEWLKVREEAKKQEGASKFTLSKTLTDNLLYYSYQEWESKEDFFKYITSKDTEIKKLAEYTEEKDIAITLTQLVPVVPYHKKHGSHIVRRSKASSMPVQLAADLLSDADDTFSEWLEPAASQGISKLVADGRDPHEAYLLIKYIVKPSEAEGFIKEVARVTEQVEKEEEGNLAYGLSKILTDDVTYYSYAVWDSKEAIEKHLKSDYARELRKYIIENDIVLQTTALFPVESLE